jgi:thioredoxin 1
MANVTELTDDTFDAQILKAEQPALVDFWAPWCGPCRMVGPIVEGLAGEYEGKAIVAKVNVDDCPGLANKYGVRSIPSLFIFKGGEIVERMVGVQPKEQLSAALDKALA